MMIGRSLFLAALSFLFLALPIWATEDKEIYHLVQVRLHTPDEELLLQRLNLDILHVDPEGSVSLIAGDADLRSLIKKNFQFEIVTRNLEAVLAERLLADPTLGDRTWPEGSMGGYYTNSEIEAQLDTWAATYPDLITAKTSIGTTIEGRDIWAVKISDHPNVDEDEPEVHYDSMTHPREVMGLMTVLYYMKSLLEGYGIDPELTYLVNHRELWFVPVHNPDGHVYNQQTNPGGGGLWRKNRRDNGGGVYGVDLARNYGFKWGYDNTGSSPNPSNISYRGTGPFSEPESQALRDFISSHPFVTSWNTHTFTNVYVCPFTYASELPYGNDWPLYQEYLQDIAAENGYPGGPSNDTLGYIANGSALDWHYADQGLIALAPEIGTWEDFFWPPRSRIVPLALENQLAIRYWSWVAGGYVRLQDHTLADDNGDGFYHPGEPVDLLLTLRNKGQAGTAGAVTVSLSSASPYVLLLDETHDFGALSPMTNANHPADPLRLELASDTPYGEVITLDLAITYDGFTQSETMSLTCGVPHLIYSLDMESDPGWTVGDTGDNASTGIWERDDPTGTLQGTLPVQPENDHTPSLGSHCFVTGNHSSLPDGDDVDNGKTTLKTGLFDLTGWQDSLISYWRWYADLGAFHSNNDLFQVDISNNNGASWVNVESLARTMNYWHEYTFSVDQLLTPTHQVRMRFIAADEPDDSLCEACIDDFSIKTYSLPLQLDLLGVPRLGATVTIDIDSPEDAGLEYLLLASLDTYPGVPLAGGQLLPLRDDPMMDLSKNPANGVFVNFSGYLDGSGHSAEPAMVIPKTLEFYGLRLFVAAMTLDGGVVRHVSAPLVIDIKQHLQKDTDWVKQP